MKYDLRKKTEKYKKDHIKEKRWFKLVCILACLTIFVTAHILKLPAITMEKETMSGLSEHVEVLENLYTEEDLADSEIDSSVSSDHDSIDGHDENIKAKEIKLEYDKEKERYRLTIPSVSDGEFLTEEDFIIDEIDCCEYEWLDEEGEILDLDDLIGVQINEPLVLVEKKAERTEETASEELTGDDLHRRLMVADSIEDMLALLDEHSDATKRLSEEQLKGLQDEINWMTESEEDWDLGQEGLEKIEQLRSAIADEEIDDTIIPVKKKPRDPAPTTELASMNIQKTFVGITQDQIPRNFRVKVNPGNYILTLGEAESSTDTEGNPVYQWTIEEAFTTGTYTITEENYDVTDYNLETTGTGSVSVAEKVYTVIPENYATTCSQTVWGISGTNFLFAASLTKSRGSIIVSEDPLPPQIQNIISNYIPNLGGPWKRPYNFYVAKVTPTFTAPNGVSISYSSSDHTVTLGATSGWQHLTNLHYTIDSGNDGEVNIVNTYTPKTMNLTVVKDVIGESTDSFDFKMTLSYPVEASTDGSYTLSEDGKTVTFSLKDNESVTIPNVRIRSEVTLTETSHDGYNVLIKEGNALLANGDQASFTINTDTDRTITVHNTPGYKLPETGGMGIKWLTLAGLLIMASAFVYGYRMRCKFGRRYK